MFSFLKHALIENGLLAAFAFVGLVTWFSNVLSQRLTKGRIHGSAFAVLIGLGLAYWGGLLTGGKRGLADLPLFAGMGLLGGAMFRDFTIVATAFEVDPVLAKKAGWLGVLSLFLGTVIPFIFGVIVARKVEDHVD